jgi:hypothetical protein
MIKFEAINFTDTIDAKLKNEFVKKINLDVKIKCADDYFIMVS